MTLLPLAQLRTDEVSGFIAKVATPIAYNILSGISPVNILGQTVNVPSGALGISIPYAGTFNSAFPTFSLGSSGILDPVVIANFSGAPSITGCKLKFSTGIPSPNYFVNLSLIYT